MNVTLIKAIIDSLDTINTDRLKLIIESLPENQVEPALEILIGTHKYLNIDIPNTKTLENTPTLIYTKPLQLLNINFLESQVTFRVECNKIPIR